MNRTEFVAALRDHANSTRAYVDSVERHVANTLADHIAGMTIPHGDDPHWRIQDHALGVIGHSVNVLKRANPPEDLAHYVREIIRETTGSDAMAEQVDKFLRPEWHLINARFLQFAEHVYDRGGLYQKISQMTGWQTSGEFGRTTLACAAFGGRIMLTFQRRVREDSVDMVSFTCDSDDPHGITGGMNHRRADLATILEMIDDVRINWTRESENFGESKSVHFV